MFVAGDPTWRAWPGRHGSRTVPLDTARLNVDFGFDVPLKIGWLLVYVIIWVLLAKVVPACESRRRRVARRRWLADKMPNSDVHESWLNATSQIGPPKLDG